MAEKPPIVDILHGEDEFQIAQKLAELETRLYNPANAEKEKRPGNAATAAMNTSRLDGNTFQLDQLLSVAAALPFLAERRLVILHLPLAKLSEKRTFEKFTRQLEQIPASTALALVLLPDKDDKKTKKIMEWIQKWAENNPERAWMKSYPLPKGGEWIKRVQDMAKQKEGQISPAAAQLLYQLLDGDPRLAQQEVEKLLAYVNYSRPVETDDVEALTVDVGQGDIFKMVDALGNRDGRTALSLLLRKLEYQDYFIIFGMVVRQFRMLIQTRELLDFGGGRKDVVAGLKLWGKEFIADRMIQQARRFSLADLKRIYHQLLGVDEAVKSSQMEGSLALETLVTALTSDAES